METIRFALEGNPHIELIKLLKACGAVRSGGEAQRVVEEGLVRRRGVVEIRKRTKILPGEIIEFQQRRIEVLP